jgi:tetratricopeptide (TPR) repeat protein
VGKGDEKLWAILNDKLDMLRGTGDLPAAIRIAETAAELAKRAFGADSQAYAVSLEKLGQLHDQAGDRAAAKPYLAKAHQVLAESEPPDHRARYRSARRLAFLCDHLGETEEAIAYYESAIESGMQLEDLPYSDLGTILNNIALTYRKSGRQKAAEPYYLHALEIYEKQLGPEHADVASVLNNLAVFYTNERRFAEAEKTHLRALAIARRSTRRPIRTSRNRSATSRSFTIPPAITRGLRSSIALRCTPGRKRPRSRRPTMRSSRRITRISSVR